VSRVVARILGTISALSLICGVFCISLTSGYSAEGGCLGVPLGMCPNENGSGLVIVSLSLSSASLRLAIPLLALAFLAGLPVWILAPIRAERRRASARTAIQIVSLLASALLMIDVIIVLSEMSLYGAAKICLGSETGTCFTGAAGTLALLINIGWGPLAGALIAGAPAWVMTLTQTARWRQWGWFVAALLFSPVAALLYAAFGPGRPAPATPASPSAPPEPAPAM
jgi:hypothetical protein